MEKQFGFLGRINEPSPSKLNVNGPWVKKSVKYPKLEVHCLIGSKDHSQFVTIHSLLKPTDEREFVI